MCSSDHDLTIASLMESQDEVVNRFTLRADLSKIHSGPSKRCSTDVVSVLLFLVSQGFEVRLDRQRHDSRRVIGKVLLQRDIVHGVLPHFDCLLDGVTV